MALRHNSLTSKDAVKPNGRWQCENPLWSCRLEIRKEEATFSLDVASSNVSPSSDAQNEQTQLSHPALIFEGSSNGRTQGFDPCYRGSSPCPSAKVLWASGEVGESQQTVNLSPIG